MGETYNGWANYETWNFNLWEGDFLQNDIEEIQNDTDEILDYGQVLEIVKGHLDNVLENQEENDITTGVLGDLLSHAIQKIDYHEVAQNIMDNLED